MSTVYILQFDYEDGIYLDWHVDEDGSAKTEVVHVAFSYLWDPSDDYEIYNWLQDCLEGLDHIKNQTARDMTVERICAQLDPYTEVNVESEEDLRNWPPDKYALLREQFDSQLKYSLTPLAGDSYNFICRISHLRQLMELAERAVAMEESDDAFERWWKEHNND